MLTNEDLLNIITEASYRLHKEIKNAYDRDNLEGYLTTIGMSDLIPCVEESNDFETYPDGKILIIGAAQIKDYEVYGCLKEFGIDKDRIELHIGYDEAKTYPFKKIQYNPNYRLILFGPVPHSGKGKQDSSSIITEIEATDGYPKVIRLSDAHGLKLTKTSLKRALFQEINTGYLAV